MAATYAEKLEVLRKAISTQPPWCGGVVPLPPDHSILYYGKPDGPTSRIDFQDASEQQLGLLFQACDVATFGVNQQSVLDETYRKAGKLDTEHVLTSFDPDELGIIKLIRNVLLDGRDATETIRHERYKLNVYGQDSFFKPHKDTPRGANMFGSLVIVFPTPHEGGALVLRDRGKEETFDSSQMLVGCEKPSIAFTAFFSDVEHEVQKVLSGYRVTLTYNLYFGGNSIVDIDGQIQRDQSDLHQALREFLDDPSLLPEGGLLGFQLHRDYPVNSRTDMVRLLQYLKGSDAAVLAACQALSLDVIPHLLVREDDVEVGRKYARLEILCPSVPQIDSVYDQSLWYALLRRTEAKLVNPSEEVTEYLLDSPEWKSKVCEVLWVDPSLKYSEVTQEYATYGNEPSVDYMYGHVCLIVSVGPPGRRGDQPQSS